MMLSEYENGIESTVAMQQALQATIKQIIQSI
jgi:hypothetical protein